MNTNKLALYRALEAQIRLQADKAVSIYLAEHKSATDGDVLHNECYLEAWRIISTRDIIVQSIDGMLYKAFRFVRLRHARDYAKRYANQVSFDALIDLEDNPPNREAVDRCEQVRYAIAELPEGKLKRFANAYLDGARSLNEAGRIAGSKNDSETKRLSAKLGTYLKEKLGDS